MRALLPAVAALLLTACATGESYRDEDVPLQTARNFDLARYMGRWYEIARFPNRFEKGCVGVTADYSLNPDGSVRVVNTCRKATLAGPVEQAEGRAFPRADPAVWRVKFTEWLPAFLAGDYHVLDVDPDYTVAVVGDPDGTTGWILGRDYVIDDEKLRHAYDVLFRNGYEMSQILLTDQPGVGS